ncbi:MAG: hypothetical protein AAFU64_17415, partial [Bacteroidota bacterium]
FDKHGSHPLPLLLSSPLPPALQSFAYDFKIPRHKKFDFQPRYYNADKEEFENRKRMIEAQVEAEMKGEAVKDENHAYRISQSFRSNRQRPKMIFDFSSNTAFIRLIIIFCLLFFGYVWLEYGDEIYPLLQSPNVQAMLGILVIYIIFRLFRR